MRYRILLASFACAGLLACGDAPPNVQDAGGGSDSGTPGSDSGTPGFDSGTPGSDSGTPGSDAGPTGDRDPFADAGAVERVDGGFVFTEGPYWVASRGALLFSDVQANRIWQYTPPGQASFTPYRQNTGGANGLGLNPAGELLACEGGNRRVSRQLSDGGVVALADKGPDGGLLFSPNDLVVRGDGTVYFTDFSTTAPAVFRVNPAGEVSLVTNARTRPNGVVLSPDEKVLYVADLGASQLWAYAVNADGTVGPGALFTPTTVGGGGGGGDGVCVDDDGNLYVATTPGLKVFRPDGGYRRTLVIPEQPANCSFGDADRRTLYITARTGLYRVRLAVPGLP